MGTEGTQEPSAGDREDDIFRSVVTADQTSDFPAEAGRYHLYISWACPWAHRAVLARSLKGLEDVISMSAVNPVRDSRGWAFTGGEYVDPINGFELLSEVYELGSPGFTQRVTVPMVWDIKSDRIVNNESSEVLRMFNSGFGDLADNAIDLYPEPLRDAIDAINAIVYPRVNKAVFRVGGAVAQDDYEREVTALFETLDELDAQLGAQRWLVDTRNPTEADWRLFTTLIRFDSVYVGHFKCNLRRIADYRNLSGYLRDLYQQPGVAATVRFQEMKDHFYKAPSAGNEYGIVPLGPILDLDAPHGRESLN